MEVAVHHNDSSSSSEDAAAVIAELERLGLEYEEAVEYQYQRNSHTNGGNLHNVGSVVGVNISTEEEEEGCYDVVTHGAQLGALINGGDFNGSEKNNIAVNGHVNGNVNGHVNGDFNGQVSPVNGHVEHRKHDSGRAGNDSIKTEECEQNNNEVKQPRLTKPKPARKPHISRTAGPKPAIAARKPHLKCLALKTPCSTCADIKSFEVNTSSGGVGSSHDQTSKVNNASENVSDVVTTQDSAMGRSDTSSITSSTSETIEKDNINTTVDSSSSNPDLNNGSSIEDIPTLDSDNDVTDEAADDADDEDKQCNVSKETIVKGPKPRRRVTQNWHKSHLRKTSKALQEQLEENPKGTLSKKQLAKLLQKGAGNIKNFTAEYLKVPTIGKFNTERIKQSGKDIRKSMTEPWQQLRTYLQSKGNQQDDNMLRQHQIAYNDDDSDGWGSEFEEDDDYVPPEGYEKPVPDVKTGMAKWPGNRPLPPPPGGIPGGPGPITPPRLQGRRREVPPPPPETNDSSPVPPPIPGTRRPNIGGPRGRSPVPNTSPLLPPSGGTPPPIPPGRTRAPYPTPDTPRLLPPSPLARPNDSVPKRPPPQLPKPPDEPDEVYEVPEDNSEAYEELPSEEPAFANPSSRDLRPLPSIPAVGRRSPRPPPPVPMATSPPPEPDNGGLRIGPDILSNIKLRKTGGPNNKQAPTLNNNNNIDTHKLPGFNTNRAPFQETKPLTPKRERGSLESNPSSEESSGSGEFSGPPSFAPRVAAASPSNQLPPRLPNPHSRALPRSPSPHPVQSLSQPSDPLSHYVWYFGEITRQEADTKVQFSEDGTFLVRRSRKGGDSNPYTLVVWCENKVWNVHLRLRSDNKYAVGSARDNEQTFSAIPELIEFHKSTPILLANERGGRRVGQTALKGNPRK